MRDLGDRFHMDNTVYYDGVRDECIKKLKAGFVTVACSAEDEDHIYGWVCSQLEPPVIHYVYVKQTYRGFGIGEALVKEAAPAWGTGTTVCSTAGYRHREWGRKYNLKYDPFSWQTNLEK